MSRAICIQFAEDSARAVIVELRGDRTAVVADVVVSWDDVADDAGRGRRLAAALAAHKPGRVPALAAVARGGLSWQTYQLPPAPPDDLADLVHLQAERDQLADQQDSFDFLPLEGDVDRPHRVLGVAASQQKTASIRAICASAGLHVTSLAPLELGWPSLAHALPGEEGEARRVAVAVSETHAVVWAVVNGRLQLLRTTPLPRTSVAAATSALTGELRRTSLALSARGIAAPTVPWLMLCNEADLARLSQVADEVAQQVKVRALSELANHELAPVKQVYAGKDPILLTTELAPLVGLAAAHARGETPLLDLWNPRRRPKPPSHARVFALAGLAAAAVAAAVGWQALRNFEAPLLAAEEASSRAQELNPVIDALADDVEQHDRVAAWLDGSPNLLYALEAISLRLRPSELVSEDFPVDQDAVVNQLTQSGQEFTMTTAIRSPSAAGAVENRLREERYQVSRQRLEAAEQAPDGYPQRLVVQIKRLSDAADATEQQP